MKKAWIWPCALLVILSCILLLLPEKETAPPETVGSEEVLAPLSTEADSAEETKAKEPFTPKTLLAHYGFEAETPYLTVGEGKDFSTLSQAVEQAEDGDVILVFPGLYEESVRAAQKTLSILGLDRETCILRYPNGDYFAPPLEMGSGLLANLTVHATAQEQVEGTVAKAYAMHVDFHISRQNRFLVSDVSFLNDDNTVLGIGLRADFTLRFQNCLVECLGDQTAFFCHDDPSVANSKNQRLEVENCDFVNHGEAYTLYLQSQELLGSEISCLWQNCRTANSGSENLLFVRHDGPKLEENKGWLSLTNWSLDPASHANTPEALNTTKSASPN